MSSQMGNRGQCRESGHQSFIGAQIFVNILTDRAARLAFIEDREDYLADFDLSQADFEELMSVDTADILAALRDALECANPASDQFNTNPLSDS